MLAIRKTASLSCLLLAAALAAPGAAWAQQTLHVVKSDINAEAENPELCLEFDRNLAAMPPSRLASALKLESGGRAVSPQNIAATGSSLCLFPLERGKDYRLSLSGLRGEDDEKMAGFYTLAFTIPDRSPSLAFTNRNGGVNGFGFYESAFSLRAVNVDHARLTVYRIADLSTMAHVWQDRSQASLAPSESVYLAHTKGQQIWQGDTNFDAPDNATAQQPLGLPEKLPNLSPGLYLIVADAGNGDAASKDLAPLAAAWFVKSDFSLRALRDSDGIHVFAAQHAAPLAKNDLHLFSFNKRGEQQANIQNLADGVGLIPYPANLADKNDVSTVAALDAAGNVAFADIEDLPPLSSQPALGMIASDAVIAAPGSVVDLSLSLTAPQDNSAAANSLVRLSHGQSSVFEFAVPSLANNSAKISFPAPAWQSMWDMKWQKSDGTLLAEAPLRVTRNPDAPHLQVESDRDSLSSDGAWPVTVKSVASSGKPVALVGGHAEIVWQKLDPAAFGWKDYHFGAPTVFLDAPAHAGDFMTDLQGETTLHLALPKPPQERGLYQASLKIYADRDSGVAAAPALVLPLRPDATTVGIKPLAPEARFMQNSIAHFALIALSSDGKPRDIGGLSYQVYEEGRSFDWYQNEGHWQYKQEPQLRPIGGGQIAIRADGGSVIEWPVTAGNYRLEILDANGKAMAQTAFSAGWDANNQAAALAPLAVKMPKSLQAGHEAVVHVTLPDAAMLTTIIADTHIRKILHQSLPKGDNAITFVPGADWGKTVSLKFETAWQKNQPSLRTIVEADLMPGKAEPAAPAFAAASLIENEAPAGLVLHKGESTTLNLGLVNNGDAAETYHYAFTAASGLKIENGENGILTIGPRESKAFSVLLAGVVPGAHEVRLDIAGTTGPHLDRSWNIAVTPKASELHSIETSRIDSKVPLLIAPARPHGTGEENIVLAARHSMDGLGEILSALFDAQPLSTVELALSADALRVWGATLAETGLAPASLIEARRQQWLLQLLGHQNADGGFGSLRGGDSTINDTAAALDSLGRDNAGSLLPARNLAVAWLKQRLSNSWVDEKERMPRAAAQAALAAADAVDLASLHYLSDTSANDALDPIAEANIAAAFKHVRDPNAAAFWIKKMLDQIGGAKKDIALLNALSETDALSSDDVHAAMNEMAGLLRQGKAPDLRDVAALLRAIAVDNADAGKWRVNAAGDIHDVSGVLVLHANAPNAAAWRNGDAQAISVTAASLTTGAQQSLPENATIARHIYRLNGVELSPGAKPMRGEPYMIELKGTMPVFSDDAHIVAQDGGDGALRPLGCPLSARMETPGFIPWFTTRELTPLTNCEFSARGISAVLESGDNDSDSAAFTLVYFAQIDADRLADIAPPRLRILK